MEPMMTKKTLTQARNVSAGSKRLCTLIFPLLAVLGLHPAAVMTASAAEPAGVIERFGEGRILMSTIKIPANAETMYLSGAGAAPLPDGSWGDMEQQAVDIFTRFKSQLEEQGWSMSDIVQVRVFGIADENGFLDFEGFNRGYLQFFGTAENPVKPVRTFVQVADLVREGWLVEVEVRAARVP